MTLRQTPFDRDAVPDGDARHKSRRLDGHFFFPLAVILGTGPIWPMIPVNIRNTPPKLFLRQCGKPKSISG